MNFIIVENVEQHSKRAKKAGAEILMPAKKQDYGANGHIRWKIKLDL